MDVLNTEVSRYMENIFQHSEILFITREVCITYMKLIHGTKCY